MAYATVMLNNGVDVKKAPIGYSWTMLLFGFLVPLFRTDWIAAIAILVASVFVPILPWFIASFFYNKYYIKSLLSKGYKVSDLGGLSEEQIKAKLGLMSVPLA